MNSNQPDYWKRCSSCKKEIPFGAKYQRCSVSTCNSGKTALTFCSVSCWDAHLGFAKHRESCAEEGTAPTRQEFVQSLETTSVEREPVRRKVVVSPSSSSSNSAVAVDTLVVVSRVKDLIQRISSFNTSQCAIDALTKIVLRECRVAMEKTRSAGRKTVMGRDFEV